MGEIWQQGMRKSRYICFKMKPETLHLAVGGIQMEDTAEDSQLISASVEAPRKCNLCVPAKDLQLAFQIVMQNPTADFEVLPRTDNEN